MTDEACTTLPVLPGGELLRELTIGGRFSAQIAARRDRADVSFEGIIDAADARRGLSLERLRQGYAEELDVETLDGETYSVFLHAPCTGSP